MTKVLPQRRWIERCVDESLKQLTAGKHHIVVVKPRGTIEKEINSAVVEHCSPHFHPTKRNMRIYSNVKDCSYSDEEDHGKIIRRMTKHTEWSVIASKVKTHCTDKTTSELLIHGFLRDSSCRTDYLWVLVTSLPSNLNNNKPRLRPHPQLSRTLLGPPRGCQDCYAR